MYRFEFAKRKHGKYKVTCPQCKKRGKFNLYYDNLKQELCSEEYGKCDRIDSCGYINRPDFDDDEVVFSPKPIKPIQPTSFLSKEDLQPYIQEKYKDPLSIWLIDTFGDVARKVLYDYAVFSVYVDSWKEYAPLFLIVDDKNRVRSGKLMRYEMVQGVPKRTKYEDYRDNVRWLHSYLPSYNYQQIAYGSHLVSKYPNKEIKIVESEKTVLMMSCLRAQYNWLAVMSYTGLQKEYLPNLKDRDVEVIPDKGQKTFDYWKEKMLEFSQENLFKSGKVSTFVENNTALKNGDDIGDYIIQKLRP